jgi:hypothetical protein
MFRKMNLILALMATLLVVASNAVSQPKNYCPGNLVTNGNFTSGLTGWSAAYGTPDLSNTMGALDNGYVGMWGNMNPSIGEGLKQTLTLVQGKNYSGSIWLRHIASPDKQPYARFRLRASSVAPNQWGTQDTVYLSPIVNSPTWTKYYFSFTAPSNATILTINVENNLSANDGAQTSYGHIDNICIREAPALSCCECLGGVTTLDLSTGQGSPIDPLWTVNLGSAFTTPPYSGWTTSLGPAQWIQPVASPTPSNNVPAGIYKYIVQFNVPKCTIPSDVRLEVKWAADNNAKVFLDNNPMPVASCTSNNCFQTGVAAPFGVTLLPGAHTLRFEVVNNEGPSGLIVNAKLTRHCAKGNPTLPGASEMESKRLN